jgi:hypothetical protein
MYLLLHAKDAFFNQKALGALLTPSNICQLERKGTVEVVGLLGAEVARERLELGSEAGLEVVAQGCFLLLDRVLGTGA